MGMNYGESGSRQGLTRSETSARNRAADRINASGGNPSTIRSARRQFNEQTGKNLEDYLNITPNAGRRKNKKK